MNWTLRFSHSISRQWILTAMFRAMLYAEDTETIARTDALLARYRRASEYLLQRMTR